MKHAFVVLQVQITDVANKLESSLQVSFFNKEKSYSSRPVSLRHILVKSFL